MKRTKKFLTAMLAMTMAASLALPAFAVEDPNQMATIRLKTNEITTFANDTKATTFDGYMLMSMTSSLKPEKEHEAVHPAEQTEHTLQCYNVSYTPNEKYSEILFSVANAMRAEGVDEITEDDKLVAFIEKLNSEETRVFADSVWDKISKADPAIKADATGLSTTGSVKVDQGYWLFADPRTDLEGTHTSRSLVLLDTKGQEELTISPKAEVPTVDKEVSDHLNTEKPAESGWGEYTDVNIGDPVYFQLTGKTLPPKSELAAYEKYEYAFRDTLSEGLDFFDGSVTVVVKNKAGEHDVTDAFTVVPVGAEGTQTTLSIFCDDILDSANGIVQYLEDGCEIIVRYQAILNNNADIGNPGNPNEVYLEYSNDPYSDGKGKTPEDEVVVFTYELGVVKVDGLDEAVKLEGAEFVLYRENNGTAEYVQVDNSGKVSGWAAATTDADGKVTSYPKGAVLTTGKDGKINISGLDKGEYKLKETKAPNGYNILKDELTVTIGAEVNDAEDALDKISLTVVNGTDTTTTTIDPNANGLSEEQKDAANAGLAAGILTTNVKNSTGMELPETGGMGTTIFYIAGGVLMVGAAVLFVTKRRMGSAEK